MPEAKTVKKEDKIAEEILISKGVSSEAQKELSPFRRFLSSSVSWVIAFEALLILIFGLLSPSGTFFTWANIFNIALNSSQIIILSVALIFVIASGSFDLSVGMNLIMTSIIGARVFKAVAGTVDQINNGEYPHMAIAIILGIAAAAVAGMAGGMLNGVFVTKLKLPAFIGTLASMYIFQGTAMVISNGSAEKGLPRAFQVYFGHKKLFGLIPYPFILAIVIGLILHLLMQYTKFGLYARAIGSNEESARRAGINVNKYRLIFFIMMGFFSAIAGMLDIARFATTNPSGHMTDGMMAIIAVVMGGTSLQGGVAKVDGAVLAALIPVTLQIGMIILRINSYYQMIAIGAFLVLAVYLDNKRGAKWQE